MYLISDEEKLSDAKKVFSTNQSLLIQNTHANWYRSFNSLSEGHLGEDRRFAVKWF